MDYIHKTVPTKDVAVFLAKVGPFGSFRFTGGISPVTWWKAGRRLGFPADLAALADTLLSALASTGNLERRFSRLPLSYGFLRGRLGIKKVSWMAFLADAFECPLRKRRKMKVRMWLSRMSE